MLNVHCSCLLSVTKFIRIGIADRNESAPFFDKLIYEADVDENEDIGNIVLNVTAKAHNEYVPLDLLRSTREAQTT
ncbi:hypothetical protein GWI33_006284 [Rhynchophorus ferrugineus]|uniref:Cadherin domain-containing protein n=1 Tax=Rhynchophorus ferrugineus TaxID=354439 RepID=A0A834MD70_RHYFE|nr:hypothetical protein GWI33_006284 [Rhynchophorus ferrugineus]